MKKSILFCLFVLMGTVTYSQYTGQLLTRINTQADTTQLRLYCQLVDSLYKKSQFDSLHLIVHRALPLAHRLHSTPHLAKLYLRLGLFYRSKGWFEKSIQTMEKARDLYAQVGDTKNRSNTLYAISLAYFDKGDYKTGIAMSLTNLDYFKKHNALLYESYTYQVLAVNYGNLKNRKLQRFYVEKFFQLAQKRNSPEESIIAYAEKASSYEMEGNYQQAWQYRKQGLRLARSLKTSILSVLHLNAAARNLRKLNRLDEALPYLQEAIQIGKQADDKEMQYYTLQEMSQNQLQRGNHQRALALAQQSVSTLQLARQPKPLDYADALKNLAMIQEATGHYRQALKTFKNYYTVNDSLLSAEKMEKVTQIQARYDLEKKEATILLLTKNAQLQKLKVKQQQEELSDTNQQQFLLILGIVTLTLSLAVIIFFLRQRTQQKQQSEIQARQLQENNTQKDQLFAIIGHDLRSPVASLKNSLTLMKLKKRAVEELDDLESQVNSLYNTLDNLLYWSLNQRNGIRVVARTVHLSELVADALEGFEGLIRFKKLSISFDHPNITVVIDENLALLVVRNVLHNAFKFTPAGGAVRIWICQKSNQTLLTITDTGIGMDLSRITQTAIKERGTGLGLQVSKELMIRNGGQLMLESELGKGTTVTLSWTV